jgi:site-specific recombinase XerD
MKINQIVTGLTALLKENNYNSKTIRFYEMQWRHLTDFLLDRFGTDEFSISKGMAYLEQMYGFTEKFDKGELSQQRVQLLRAIHLLEDYMLHGVLTRRYHASKNPIELKGTSLDLHCEFVIYLQGSNLSKSTSNHYESQSKVFLDYLSQRKLDAIHMLTLKTCNDYITTFAGYSYKTVEQNICSLRFFLRFLNTTGKAQNTISDNIHMPRMSKLARIPSVWTEEDLRLLLATIDRNSPIGKRDYAMILCACLLGLRSLDIKCLVFENFDWSRKILSIVQHKTGKPLSLPLPDVVGWAIIDYIRNGRPKCYDTKVIFIKHMPPFDAISENNHLASIIIRYMNKAGIRRTHKSGFHSLRHSAASMMLEAGTQLPIITEILGHSNSDITSVYLKTDIERLRGCVLPLHFEQEDNYGISIQ